MFEHRSAWWKSDIKVERDKRNKVVTLIPVEPFIEYDPFDWYFPVESATRKNRSLPYLFLDVDASKPEEVISFCEKFGVLGDDGTFFQWIIDTSPDTFAVKGKNITYNEFVKSEITTHEQRKQLTEDLLGLNAGKRPDPSLCVPMRLKDFQIAQNQLREAITLLDRIRDPKVPKIEKKGAQNALNWIFSIRLGFARPGLSWDDQASRFVTGWDVGSLSAVMYLMLLFDTQGKGNVLTCPRCHKVFLGDHPRTQFCSPRCQNQNKVAEFRKRKLQTKKGKFSHGKAKLKG